MKVVKIEANDPKDYHLMFKCPGCKQNHGINQSWQFNGDFELPTINPSILVKGTIPITDEEYERIMQGEKIVPKPFVCHSFIREGKIQFLNDCTHELSGQTIELPDWDDKYE